MLFKGTETRNAFDIVHSLESLGGNLDAFTSRDLTCFYARCLDEHLDAALDILADMLQNSRLDPEDIEKEKRVVLDEIQSVEDTPDDLIHDLIARSAWGGHPVGAPVLGTHETVASFDRRGLLDYLEHHYRPNRMVISAAGNLDHDRLVDRVSQLFDLGGSPGSRLNRTKPDGVQPEVRHYRRDIGQTHICVGTTVYPYTHPRRYDLLVANAVLGGGMSSRLFQEVRERLGLAYAVYSYLEMLEDTGLMAIYMACDRKRRARSVEVLQSELDKLKENGISQEELESARAQLRGELMLGLESMDRRMGRIAREEIYTGECHPPEDALAAIDAVTREGVQWACRELLGDSRMHKVTVGP
jgi:predicted Zn-dependent peptidase